jgi:hypothetical protein
MIPMDRRNMGQLSISKNPVHISIVDVTSSARLPRPEALQLHEDVG